MNKQKNKKKVIAFLLSMLMLISLFQNISYTPVAEGGETENVASESDAETLELLQEDSAIAVQSNDIELQGTGNNMSSGENKFSVTGYDIQVKKGNKYESIKDSDSIYAGQDIQLTFNWKLENGAIPANSQYTISATANKSGINIPPNATGGLYDKSSQQGKSVGYYVVNNDGSITITFTDTEYLTSKDGRTGTVSFSGTIENLNDNTKDNTNQQLIFGDYTSSPKYYVSDTESSASVQKYQSAKKRTDAGYQITYRAKVSASNGTVTNINLKDTPTPAEKFGTVTDVKIVESSGNTLNNNTAYNSWDDAVEAVKDATFYKDGYVTIEYKVTVDDDAILSSSNYKNTLSGTYTSNRSDETKNTNSSEVTLNLTKPEVNKSALSYDSSTGNVTWKIEIKVGDMYDSSKPALSNYVTNIEDILGEGLKAPAPTIGVSDPNWTSDGNGTFTYTYTTTVTDDVKNSLVDQTVKNTVKTTLKNGDQLSKDAAYTISAAKASIEKTFKSYDPNTKTITWEITAKDIPQGVTNITLVEKTVYYWIEGATVGQHGLESSFTLKGEKYSGNDFTENGAFANGRYVLTNSDVKSFVATVTTKITDTSTSGRVYRNGATLEYTSGNKTQKIGEVTADFEDSSNLLTKTGAVNDSDNTINYTVSSLVNVLESGKKFVFKDTLPQGMELTGAVKVGYGPYTYSITDLTGTGSNTTKAGDKDFTITVPYTEAMKNAAANQKIYIYLQYSAKISDEAAFVKGGQAKEFTNTASATYDSKSIGTASDTKTLTPKKIVSKSAEYTQISAPFIHYTIKVNENGLTLNNGNPLTAVDTIGSALTFTSPDDYESQFDKDKCPIVVTDKNGTPLGAGEYSFNISPDKHTITFTIPDGKCVIIKYSAVAPKKTQLTTENSTNKFTLSGFSNNYTGDSYSFNQMSFTPTGTAESNISSITIRKFWTDGNQQIALKGSKFRLESVKYDKLTNAVSPVTLSGNSNSIVRDNITLGSDGKVVIDNLLVNQLYALYEIDADASFALNREPYYFYVGDTNSTFDVPANTKKFDENNTVLGYENEKAGILVVKKSVAGSITKAEVEGVVEFQVKDKTTGNLIGTYKLGDANFPYDPTTQTWTLTLGNLKAGNYTVEETVSDTTSKIAQKVEYSTDAGTTWIAGKSLDIDVVKETTTNVEFKNTYTTVSAIAISKRTMDGANLTGASLELYKGDGTTGSAFASWTSRSVAQQIAVDDSVTTPVQDAATKVITINPGRYTLKEKIAPAGYDKANAITFDVSADGKITLTGSNGQVSTDQKTLIMTDEKLGSLKIVKEIPTDSALGWNDIKDTIKFTVKKGTTVVREYTANDFSLNNGGKYECVLSNLEAGDYTVIESDVDRANYTRKTTYHVGTNAETAGDSGVITIANNADSTITYTNKYEVKTGKIAVYKTIDVTGITGLTKENAVRNLKFEIAKKTNPETVLWSIDGAAMSQLADGRYYKQLDVDVPIGDYIVTEKNTLTSAAVKTSYRFGVTAKDGVSAEISVRDGALSEIAYTNTYTSGTTVKISKKDITSLTELPGALLRLYKIEGTNAILKSEWTSSANQKSITLEAGEYRLDEVEAPTGYTKANSIAFTIAVDGSITKSGNDGNVDNISKTVTMTDKKFKVLVNKTDLDDNFLPGAKIALYRNTDIDGSGNVKSGTVALDSWVSTNASYDISSKIKLGETYVLVETIAPDGYLCSKNISFKIKDDGTIEVLASDANSAITTGTAMANSVDNEITIKDAVISSITISKVEISNGSANELPGASMELYEENNMSPIKTWISTSNAEVISGKMLKIGTSYRIHEKLAPEGYELARDILFKIDKNGNLVDVQFAYGSDTNQRLIVMKDVREDITSSETSESTETTDTTTEVTTTEITTTEVTTTEITTTEVTTATTTETTTSTNTATKTGDATPVAPITVIMLVAAAGITILGVSRKKRNDK